MDHRVSQIQLLGPPFRKSTEKHRVAFAPVPTNLHVHHSTVDQRVARGVLSCGTASALPLRFQVNHHTFWGCVKPVTSFTVRES
ncbi:hypothetical protein ANCDUO_23003 [Ancylostoma duodenale]|uniref:Uncharacterized protein n=1 Tax=Ancylostoma duodenale TaxID=51022 RepID=A0A0C2FPX5_9BILA|nr:hypothetical protein ANCDUO_23003 [Ancylostoma duodenale]